MEKMCYSTDHLLHGENHRLSGTLKCQARDLDPFSIDSTKQWIVLIY